MSTEIEITNNGKFLTLKCTEGHKITEWNEGDDIKDYNDFTIAYVGLNADTDKFHCVSDEESEKYHKLRDEYMEEMRKKEDEERETEHKAELEIEENN